MNEDEKQLPQDNASSGRTDHSGVDATRPVEVVEGTPDEEPADRKDTLNQK